MKYAPRLFDQILEYNNLLDAFYKAAKGKTCRENVVLFRKDLACNLVRLQKELASDAIEFGRYNFFTVHDPKTRKICAASFNERVAHHALMNVCGLLLDRTQIFHSYACRKGRGQHKALETAKNWSMHHDYYLKMDIVKFFDSIDHSILKKKLSARFKGRRLLKVFGRIIDSYEASSGKGLPLGNLTSQYFANFYLNSFDLEMKHTLKARFYMRYMDDMLALGSKEDLLCLRKKAGAYLNAYLHLDVKHGGQINRTGKGIGFLGAVVYPGYIRLSRRAKKRVRARVKSYEKQYRAERLNSAGLQERVNSLWSGILHAKSYGWRKRLALSCMDI